MRNFINIVVLFCTATAVTSTNALAEQGWSGKASITKIFAVDNNRILLKLSDFENPGNCAVSHHGDVYLETDSHPNWYTMALAAYMGGKTVNLYLHDVCLPIWEGTSFAKIGHFTLVNP